MPRLLCFYPENDLALARDKARYTAPPAAVRLRMAGATLPLFYGERGDLVLAGGVNARWLGLMRDRLGIYADIYRHDSTCLAPAPWGWSKASRQIYLDMGFEASALPSDDALEHLRRLSHRSTASALTATLGRRLPFGIAPPAMSLDTIEDVYDFIVRHPEGAVLKLPWSSSGRGLVFTDSDTAPRQRAMLEGMLRRQSCLMGEPRHRRLLDFAMLCTMAPDGRCSFDGYSLFTTDARGAYSGNVLAPQTVLRSRIATLAGGEDSLAALERALPPALEEVLGAGYSGPLGVDMMAVDSPDCGVAVAELNLRMTMGHLCRTFYERHVLPGATGTFAAGIAVPGTAGTFSADTFDGRVRRGTVDLAQPGAPFSFTVTIDA